MGNATANATEPQELDNGAKPYLGRTIACTAPQVELAIYALKSDRIGDFQKFYDDTIVPWMEQYSLEYSRCWLVDNCLVVINPTLPWDIPGFDDFLAPPPEARSRIKPMADVQP